MILPPDGGIGSWRISAELPKPNFSLAMGETECSLTFEFRVEKTLVNRLKYWLFCTFFPFRVVRWDV